MVSRSVTEQNTSVGNFCSTETPVMRTTQCSQHMSSIVLCPSFSDVLAICVLERAIGNSDNKLVTMSLPCVQYQMGEHSDTQGGYLSDCSEPKSYPLVQTRVSGTAIMSDQNQKQVKLSKMSKAMNCNILQLQQNIQRKDALSMVAMWKLPA